MSTEPDESWRQINPRVQLGHDEAWKSITAQSTHVDGIKTRTTAALTAAGVVLALTTSNLFPRIGSKTWDWVALVVFAVHLLGVLQIMRPRAWEFVRDPAAFSQFWDAAAGVTMTQMLMDMWGDAVGYYDANRHKIRSLERAYVVVVTSLGLLVVAVSVALIKR